MRTSPDPRARAAFRESQAVFARACRTCAGDADVTAAKYIPGAGPAVTGAEDLTAGRFAGRFAERQPPGARAA